jgi:hypothetical protein
MRFTDRVMGVFLSAVGAFLLAGALMLAVGGLTGAGLVLPRDPIFAMSSRALFAIAGGLMAGVALLLLCGRRSVWRIGLLAWLAAAYWCYRGGMIWSGYQDVGVFLAPVASAFRIPAGALGMGADLLFGMVQLGGMAALGWLWVHPSEQDAELVKTSCPACGGHISFVEGRLGQQIPCPHCQKTVTLRKPENLKMSCYFCKGRIEFPSHAIGSKLRCPHCNMDITLKEAK